MSPYKTRLYPACNILTRVDVGCRDSENTCADRCVLKHFIAVGSRVKDGSVIVLIYDIHVDADRAAQGGGATVLGVHRQDVMVDLWRGRRLQNFK